MLFKRGGRICVQLFIQQINEFSKRFPAAFRARIRLFRFARGQP